MRSTASALDRFRRSRIFACASRIGGVARPVVLERLGLRLARVSDAGLPVFFATLAFERSRRASQVSGSWKV
jgi:hypothetical protein